MQDSAAVKTEVPEQENAQASQPQDEAVSNQSDGESSGEKKKKKKEKRDVSDAELEKAIKVRTQSVHAIPTDKS